MDSKKLAPQLLCKLLSSLSAIATLTGAYRNESPNPHQAPHVLPAPVAPHFLSRVRRDEFRLQQREAVARRFLHHQLHRNIRNNDYNRRLVQHFGRRSNVKFWRHVNIWNGYSFNNPPPPRLSGDKGVQCQSVAAAGLVLCMPR